MTMRLMAMLLASTIAWAAAAQEQPVPEAATPEPAATAPAAAPAESTTVTAPAPASPARPEPPVADKPVENANADLARENLTHQEMIAESSLAMAISAGLGVMLTIAGLFMIFRTMLHTAAAAKAAQAAVTEGQRAAKAAEDSVKESQAAAHAAQQSVDVAQETAYRQLRAYLMISQIYIRETRDQEFEISVKLKNSGQTPARQPSWKIVGSLVMDGPVTRTLSSENYISLDFAGGASAERYFTIPVSRGDPNMVMGNKASLRVQVTIDYKTTFFTGGPAKADRSTSCTFVLDPETWDFLPDLGTAYAD